MLPGLLEFAKNILHPNSVPVDVHINVSPRDMEQRNHLLHIRRNLQRVDVARRLVSVAPLLRPPRVLQVVPAAFEDCGVDGPGVAVPGEDAGFADAQEVDEVALRDGEENWAEPDVGALGDPETFVDGVGAEDAGDDEVFAYVGEGRASVCCVMHVHSRG